MNRNLLRMARRALGKPPSYVAWRAFQELQGQAERFLGPRRARAFGRDELLARTDARSLGELWERLAERPYVGPVQPIARDAYEALCPGDAARILHAAERALAHRVNLLGSGEIHLGDEIDWHKDYKSGYRWPPAYCRDIDYMNPGRPSDVKFPWELSRVQWLIPCGQAWLLTGDERFAAGARRILESWLDANPYAGSVNWSCTMDVALRILSWTWLFHALHRSASWSDEAFRARFLCSLYLHADFTDRHFEYADVNGNHCDADAAGLVFAGLFFGGNGEPRRWIERGWKVLCEELPRQVSEDGVDFEGSVPYHRLVTELFFLPALYRRRCGLEVPAAYRERVTKMAWFTEAYTRPDGSAPVWGDADDGRALPFGGQPINDHRYLIGCIGHAFGDTELARRFSGDRAECAWLLGLDAVRALSALPKPSEPPRSVLFEQGGYAVLRNERDHVFVDCAGVGAAGRGWHGHNDVLSFAAFLDGEELVVDCGAYVYSADYEARNAFRSTAYHNTPKVNGQEVNRFRGPQDLFWLHDDAKPEIREFDTCASSSALVAAHSGYRRLSQPATVVRRITLDHESHRLTISDTIDGSSERTVEAPLHLAPGVKVEGTPGNMILTSGERRFSVHSEPSAWALRVEPTRLSPSYGVLADSRKLVWRYRGRAPSLLVRLSPRQDPCPGPDSLSCPA